MKYRVKTNLNHDKTEYAPGTLVDLTEAQAAPLLPDVVEPVGTTVADPAPVHTDPAPENELSISDLRARAKELGLPANGSKEDLKERIAEAEAEAAESASLPEDAPVGVLSENDEDPGANL